MMRKLWEIMRKEFRVVVRTPVGLFLLALCPIVMVGLVPFGLSGSVRIRLSVVDQSFSERGLEKAAILSRSPFFSSVDMSLSMEEATARMEHGELDGIVVIPADGEGYTLLIDATHNALAADVQYYVQKQLGGLSIDGLPIRSTRKFLSSSDNKHYYIVAMLVLLISIIGSGLSMYSVLVDREHKTIEHLRSTGVPAGLYVMSKVLFFSLVGLMETAVGLLIASLVFDFHVYGSLWAFILLATCFLFCMTSLGVTIATYSKNLVQATYILVFLFCMLSLISTMFVPLDTTARFMGLMRFINPFYWVTDGGWKILLKGAGMADIPLYYAVLFGAGVLLSVANILKIKQTD